MAHSMDSILSDSSFKEPSLPDAPESDSSPAVSTEPKSEKAEPVERAQPKPATEPQKAAEEVSEEDSVPEDLEGLKRALKAARGDKRKERKKWQEVERQYAELRGRYAALSERPQPQVGQPVAAPSPEDEFYLDPVGTLRKVEQRVVGTVTSQLRTLSVARMRAEKEDYDSTVGDFAREVRGTAIEQQLNAQLANHPDPARLAYEYARNYKRLEGASSVEELEKRIEARVRAEIEAERPDRSRPPAPKPSIAGARGNGVSPTAQWTGPRSMDEILNRR